MKVTQFDRSNIPLVRQRIQQALKGVEEETGIQLKVGACRFSSKACTFKLEAGTISESGRVTTPEAARFEQKCYRVGLSPSDLWETFTYNGDRYRIIGMTQKIRNYPIICECFSGGSFRFSASIVREKLEQARGAQS